MDSDRPLTADELRIVREMIAVWVDNRQRSARRKRLLDGLLAESGRTSTLILSSLQIVMIVLLLLHGRIN